MLLTKPSLYRVQQCPFRKPTIFSDSLIHSRPKKVKQCVFRAAMRMFEQQDIPVHATHLKNHVVQIFHKLMLETVSILSV